MSTVCPIKNLKQLVPTFSTSRQGMGVHGRRPVLPLNTFLSVEVIAGESEILQPSQRDKPPTLAPSRGKINRFEQTHGRGMLSVTFRLGTRGVTSQEGALPT